MQHAQQPTYHFPTQQQQPQPQQQQQFIRTHHFSHVTSASGSHTEPKKIARVQPQMQSQQTPRSTSSGMPRATASATSSSSRPMASTSGGNAMQQGEDNKDKVKPYIEIFHRVNGIL